MWFSKLATPRLIGKPLFPISPVKGLDYCGINDTAAWGEFAGDVEYNIRNRCCRIHNQGSWSNLIETLAAQETMAYLFSAKGGRRYFVDFVGELANAVANKSAVMGINPSLE